MRALRTKEISASSAAFRPARMRTIATFFFAEHRCFVGNNRVFNIRTYCASPDCLTHRFRNVFRRGAITAFHVTRKRQRYDRHAPRDLGAHFFPANIVTVPISVREGNSRAGRGNRREPRIGQYFGATRIPTVRQHQNFRCLSNAVNAAAFACKFSYPSDRLHCGRNHMSERLTSSR